MNFVADHQRAQEYLPTLYHHHDNNRQDQHYYPSPSPCPSTYSQPQSPLPPSPYSQSTSFSHTSSIRGTLPEVGQTRCYWALLSTDLRFLVLDPVLAYHLREQANDILDTSLLEFVHPEERASAKEDLGGVLRERTLHGSVTRVRFCRLSCVRRLLGYTPSEEAPPYPPTFPAERIAIDNNYMAIDIVLNWAAEGVVLCFLHAVVDIAPREDNDESLKTGWSNWCSTYGFDEEQAKGMITRLSDTILPQMHAHRGQRQDPSLRVLQILRNDQDRSLMLSWPPDDVSTRSYTTVPHAQDLGRLAQHVEIGSSGASGDARTSCTRRYKSFQKMPAMPGDGSCVEVESIFVPHGTIIFACHKIDYVRHTRDSYCSGTLYQCSGTQGMVVDYPPSAARSHPDYDLGGATYDLSYTEEELSEGQLTQSSYVAQWVEGQSSPYAYESQQRHWSYAHAHEHTPSPNSSTHDTGTQIDNVMTGISYATYETECTKHQESAGNVVNVHARSSSSALADRDIRTPARSVRKGNSTRGAGDDVVDSPTGISKPGASREVYSGGRSSGNPPVGVSRCASCGATHSPEWRKGPSGKKDLCNACGLRYARSRAKKEGTAARKRKEKDKGPIKRISPSSLSTVANGEPITLHDEAMFDGSNQLSRSSPSIVSDTPGPPQPPQSGRTHHGSSRTYNRSGEEYIKHNGFTSEEELSPSFVQGSNHQRSLLGVNAMTVSSALVPSLGNENSTGGSYGAQLEGHNYKHTSVSPTDSFDQNRLQNIHGRPSLHPSSPRISRSSPLRTTMDL